MDVKYSLHLLGQLAKTKGQVRHVEAVESISTALAELGTTPNTQRPKYPADCRYKSTCETVRPGLDRSDVCAKSIGRCPHDI
jgi:hypothetical protein